MLGHYRTRIDLALKQLANATGRRLGLRHNDYFVEAFDVETNEVIANGTNAKSFHSHLMVLVLENTVEIVTVEEPISEFALEFGDLSLDSDE